MSLSSPTKAINALFSATLLIGLASPGWCATSTPLREHVSTDVKSTTEVKPPKLTAAQKLAQKAAGKLVQQGYLDMQQSNWQESITEFCEALRIDRNNAMARRYLCYALLQSRSPKEALAQLDALSSLRKDIAFDMTMRGEALDLTGDADKAIDAFRAAIAMDETSDYVREKLIASLQNHQRYQLASLYSSQGYFSAKTPEMKAKYLATYNSLQQARMEFAQRALGMTFVANASVPMLNPETEKEAAAILAPTKEEKQQSAAAAKDMPAAPDDTDDDAKPKTKDKAVKADKPPAPASTQEQPQQPASWGTNGWGAAKEPQSADDGYHPYTDNSQN